MGGGAVFFSLWRAGRLEGRRIVLGDSNLALMHCYQALRDRLPLVLKHLRRLEMNGAADGLIELIDRVKANSPTATPTDTPTATDTPTTTGTLSAITPEP